MRKFTLIISVLIITILVGCSNDETIKDKPPENNNTNDTSLTPPNFSPYSGDYSTHVVLDEYCWEAEDKTCAIEPNPPNEVLLDHQFSPLKSQPGEEITFTISTSGIPENNDILNPDSIEIIQHRMNEEEEIEVIDQKMTLPTETGRYYYTAILRWDSSLKGEAAYAFSISVQ